MLTYTYIPDLYTYHICKYTWSGMHMSHGIIPVDVYACAIHQAHMYISYTTAHLSTPTHAHSRYRGIYGDVCPGEHIEVAAVVKDD